MIRIKLNHTAGRFDIVAREDDTIISVLDANDVNYEVGAVFLNGKNLTSDDLDMTFEEAGVKETARLTVVVKTQNAAKVTIAGNSCVITSSMTLADLQLAEKLNPEALILTNEKDDEIFRVSHTEKNASGYLNKFGATFGSRANAEGKATITLSLPEGVSNPAEYVEEEYGLALLMISTMEEGMPEVMEAIRADKAAIKEMIQVI